MVWGEFVGFSSVSTPVIPIQKTAAINIIVSGTGFIKILNFI